MSNEEEQPVGEYPDLPPNLFYMQRILLALNWDGDPLK
jgi:hypothetical protein